MSRPDGLILGRTLREHAGGRWAISWLVIVVGAPMGFVAGLNNMTDATSPARVGEWVQVSLIGVLVIIGILMAAHVTVFRNRAARPVPLWWVVALGMVVGASRSAVTIWLSWQWNLVDVSATYVGIRVTTGALLGGVLLPLVAIQASIVSTYLSQRRELELELRNLEVERMRQSGRSEALREALVSQVASELNEVSTTFDAEGAREVSRRLWESAPSVTVPSVRWPQVLRVAVTHNPYPTALAVVLWTIAAFGSLVISVGLVRAVVQVGLSIAGISTTFAVARFLTARFPRLAVVTLVGVIVLLIVWTGLAAPALVGTSPSELTSGTLLATAVWIPLLVITTGMVVSAVRSGDEVVQRLRDVIEDQQIAVEAETAESARIQQELATLLHGSVQSRLLAASAVIRQPGIADASKGDPGSALRGALALMAESATRSQDFAQELAEIVQSWRPLMEIEVQDVEFDMSRETQMAVLRVVEEGLSNAYRHGGASIVVVALGQHDGAARIRIEDNGGGVPEIRTPGLGSAVLDSVAPGSWSLSEASHGGAVLHVVLSESAV